MLLDELDRLTHGLDLLGSVVGNVDLELFFEFHHQLDGIERVSPQVLDERCFGGDLILAHTKLGSHDVNHSILD